jgi:hypothetical protein
MKHLTLVLACVLLTGCAQTVWTKPGATEANFIQDRAGCTAQAAAAADPIFAQMFLGDCLRGKGWTSERRPRE